MGELTTDDRTRLVKILGLLGSEHAGERDAAALRATGLLAERGLAWDDVLAAPMTVDRLLAHFQHLREEAKKQPRVVVVRSAPAGARAPAGPRPKKPPLTPEEKAARAVAREAAKKAAQEAAMWRSDLLFCLRHQRKLTSPERELVVPTQFMRSAGAKRRQAIVEVAARLRAAGLKDDRP